MTTSSARHNVALKCSILQKTAYPEGHSPAVPIPGATHLAGPKNFDAFRELAQAIAHETTTDKNGNIITIAERILRSWAESKEPMLQRSFIEYCYGKPPDKIETNLAPKTILRLHYAHEFPDWKQPDGSIIAVNGEGTRRPLLPDAD